MAVQIPLLLGLSAVSAGYSTWRTFKDSGLEWQRNPGAGTSTYRGGRYCGPGWGFVREDVESGRITRMPDAIDAIDQACRQHDQCYFDHGWFTRECNLQMTTDLVAVIRSPVSSPQQRVDATVMAAVFAVEADLVDPWLRPASRFCTATSVSLRSAFEEMFQGAATMFWLMEHELYRIYGVPR